MSMAFIHAIENAWEQDNSLLCVGLDGDIAKIPAYLRGKDSALFEFNKAIVDATADLVCAYKPKVESSEVRQNRRPHNSARNRSGGR